jgi:hypothetical protein
MTNNDLPALRQLAANGQIIYTYHGQARMLERGYLISDVTKILTSPTNQIVEVQAPSTTPGKEHRDERVLISDPMYQPDTVVLISMDFSNPSAPSIVVVTVEEAMDGKWNKCHGNNPWLVRK